MDDNALAPITFMFAVLFVTIFLFMLLKSTEDRFVLVPIVLVRCL